MCTTSQSSVCLFDFEPSPAENLIDVNFVLSLLPTAPRTAVHIFLRSSFGSEDVSLLAATCQAHGCFDAVLVEWVTLSYRQAFDLAVEESVVRGATRGSILKAWEHGLCGFADFGCLENARVQPLRLISRLLRKLKIDDLRRAITPYITNFLAMVFWMPHQRPVTLHAQLCVDAIVPVLVYARVRIPQLLILLSHRRYMQWACDFTGTNVFRYLTAPDLLVLIPPMVDHYLCSPRFEPLGAFLRRAPPDALLSYLSLQTGSHMRMRRLANLLLLVTPLPPADSRALRIATVVPVRFRHASAASILMAQKEYFPALCLSQQWVHARFLKGVGAALHRTRGLPPEIWEIVLQYVRF
jgi:hypothetical protein